MTLMESLQCWETSETEHMMLELLFAFLVVFGSLFLWELLQHHFPEAFMRVYDYSEVGAGEEEE